MDIRTEVQALFELDDFPSDHFDLQKTFEDKKVILYGAGEGSIWYFEIVRDIFGYPPHLILDRRFEEETEFQSVKAITPEKFHPTEKDKQEALVIICTGRVDFLDQIMQTLQALGFSNIIQLRDIYEIHNPFSQPPELSREGFTFFKDKKEQILAAYDLLADESSQRVFLGYLRTHMLRKPELISDRPRDEQYFPTDIPLTKGYRSFVSCGAYDGDTVRSLNARHGTVDEIVCFEAEPAIFDRLQQFLHANSENLAKRITAFPCAAYDVEKLAGFTSSTGLGSRISDTGEATVQCVALDHVLPNLKPTIITMDIEGAEPFALRGAEKIIQSHKPDLAVCVYHSPNHLWEIPLYLNQLGLGYRFYLRNYTSFCIETVLYASQ